MLFSNDDVADFLNGSFECVWESVRPVPEVTIDFDNGYEIRRTIGGNFATLVCTTGGDVLDVLPGAYSPDVYVRQLTQILLFHQWLRQIRRLGNPDEHVRYYHREQARAIGEHGEPAHLVARWLPSIAAGEGLLRFSLAQPGEARDDLRGQRQYHAARIGAALGIDPSEAERLISPPDMRSAEALEEWPVLAEETKQNETTHRKLIHERLAEIGLVRPDQVTGWLFREVLDTDLEDPYLGLGRLLRRESDSSTRGDESATRSGE